MQADHPYVYNRSDTLLGVCQALGDDLGFNPIFLRIGLALPLIPAPVAVLSVYASLAVIVAVSRLLFPNPRLLKTAIESARSSEQVEEKTREAASADAREMALAA